LIAVIVAVECLAAANTSAQSQVTLVPAAAVATIYDDNLFSAPKGVADVVTSVRPSLEGRYESPTANISSFAYFDMQRSLNNPTLTTLDARRHAMVDGRVQASPQLGLGVAARYDHSDTPSDLNLDTAILLPRQRARRVQFTPSLAYRANPRTSVTARYDWTSEDLSGWTGAELHSA